MKQKIHQWKFLVLLGSLLLLLVVEPCVRSLVGRRFVFDVLYSLMLLAAIVVLYQRRGQRVLAVVLGLPTVLLPWISQLTGGTPQIATVLVGHSVGAVFLLIVAVTTVQSTLAGGEISLDSIFGAVSGYLLLGVAWGVLYSALEIVSPGSFVASEALSEAFDTVATRVSVLIYYSFVTITTLGYGDVSPVSAPARSLAWLEAMTGQFYIAILVAGLVGVFVAKAVRDVERRSGKSAP